MPLRPQWTLRCTACGLGSFGTTLPLLLGTSRASVRTDVTVSSDTAAAMTAAATHRQELGFAR